MSQPAHATASSAAVRALQLGQHALFTLLYVVACALTGLRTDLTAGTVVLMLALGACYVLGIVLARRAATATIGAAWVAALVLCWAPLAAVAPTFRYLVLPLFLLALHLLPRWAGVGVVAALTIYVIVLDVRSSPQQAVAGTLGPLLGAAVAGLFAYGYTAALREAREKSRLVAELVAARDDLEALQDELARTQRESGALAERSRLARDIHDTLAQGFSSVLLLARAARSTPAAAPETLTQIEQVAAENLEEARRVVHALAPAQLERAPLPDALHRLAERSQEQSGVRIQVDVEGDPRPIPTSIEVGLLRFTQGALANIRQHSRATRARLTLSYGPDDISLDIVDDGVGFDPDSLPRSSSGGGFGLRAMRERMAELGGTLDVESAPGDGTALAAHIRTER